MPLNFLKWNSNTADVSVSTVVVLGGLGSDLVLVLRVGASPLLWGSDQMWLSLSLRAPSIHHHLFRSQLPPKFQAQARPQVTFQIILPPHPQADAIPAFGLTQ